MKRWLLTMTLALAVAAPAFAAPVKMAKCVVCAVNHGETAEEEVKATRTHAGKEYGFCSEKCAAAFDADPAAYLPPEFPRAAPDFTLTDLSGKRLALAELKGRAVLLDFWATWCKPCVRTMPELQALHEKFGAQGLTVIGASTDAGGADKVRKFVAARKIHYAVAVDGGRSPVWERYGVRAIPAAYLIDREGRIVAQWTGAPAAGELEAKVKEVLGTANAD